MDRFKHPNPPGFIRLSETKKDSRRIGMTKVIYYFKCAYIHPPTKMPCSFKIRTDKVRFEILNDGPYEYKNLEHTHKMQVSANGDNAIEKLNFQKKIMKLCSLFIVKSNLSIRFASDSDFKGFVETLLYCGHSIPDDFNISDVVKQFTERNFKKEIDYQAKLALDERLLEFNNCKFGSLTIDAGTVNHTCLFTVYLCNPSEEIKPVVIYVGTNRPKSESAIIEDIKLAIKRCGYILITGITGDNYRPQVKAIKSIILENKTNIGHFLVFNSCACHVINLILTDCYKNNQSWRRQINNLRNIGKNYNKQIRSAETRCFCPEHCPTRWVNDIDIAYFLFSKRDIIKNMFNDVSNFIDADLIDILIVLIPFRSAIQMLEGDLVSVSLTFPVFQDIINYFNVHSELVLNENTKDLIQSFINIIKDRKGKTMNGRLIELSYVLTPKGRLFVRSHLQNDTYEKDEFDFSEMIDDVIISFEKKYINNILVPINSPWFDQEEEEEDEQEEILVNEELDQDDTPEQIIDDNGIFDNCAIYIMKIARELNMDANNVYNQFTLWIYGGISNEARAKSYMKDTVGLFWRKMQNDPNYADLALIARRITSIMAAEAVNERGFSLRRRVVPKGRQNTSENLAQSRCFLTESSKPLTIEDFIK